MKSEEILQITIVQWLRRNAPEAVVFHTPNGGSRNAREGQKLKDMGVLAGVPDLIVLWPGGKLAIELKSDKGRTSQDQKDVLAKFEACGFPVAVCRSQIEVIEALRRVGCPL